ncbi:uncharacterized protein A1O9_09906 [Exophiala aquamarina CBS 119918]|uniref:Choline transport protein n=1 Tax=Exophiala aquamarina CBS 119918 TaxID=1182545 RepID=A0A072P2N2_9EURO|nr:uncharacterized protein A1O9_09906 [Exophiala aquamarina CBS 119918]KEF54111.1 hypothetical protein A1O9_09906 [Exophiala aquamarina CBS 119918]
MASSDAAIEQDPTRPTTAADIKLTELGYKPELRRQYSQLAVTAIAVITCNSWGAVGGSLITGMAFGGPPTIIYGWLLVTFVSIFTALSLGEFASAYPTSAGPYFWVAAISPRHLVAPLSYLTGLLNLVAWIVTTSAATLFLAQCVMAMISLCTSDFVIERWMTFLVYTAFLLAGLTMATVGDRLMPKVVQLGLLFTALGCFVSATVVLATSSHKASAKDVFQTFINQSGWSSNGIAACIGLINPSFGFAGFDAAIHYAEEIKNPSIAIPRALISLVGINFVTGLFFFISIFFSVTNYDAVLATTTGLPLAEMYRQAGGLGVGVGLTFVVFIAGIPAMFDIFIATVRLTWAFARDNGLPFSDRLATVNAKLGVPLWAAVAIAVIEILLGVVYIGNTTAFSAFISSSLILNNLIYVVPILVNMVQGRQAVVYGPFRLKGIFGWLCNSIVCCWILFTVIFFQFPFFRPVTPANMNYTVVILMATVILGSGWFLLAGHSTYHGPESHITVQGVPHVNNQGTKGETKLVLVQTTGSQTAESQSLENSKIKK